LGKPEINKMMNFMPKCEREPELAESKPGMEDMDRPPLPAGHPVSWGVLTENTVLEGVAYPLPVFA
jgi:hypothetical protein